MRAASGSPFATHLRVVAALLHREAATRYGRSAGGYLWAIAEPVGVVAMLSLVFAAITRTPALGDSFIAFFATGYVGFLLYRSVAETAAHSLMANQPLLRFPAVDPWDAICARILLQALTNVAVAFLVVGGAFAVTGEAAAPDPLRIGAAFGAATLLGAGIGCCNAVLFPWAPLWQRIFGILTRPLFLISGVFFLPESMPRDIQEGLSWNPLVHVVSAFREGIYPVYHAKSDVLLYPAGLGLLLLLCGLMLVRTRKGRMGLA